MPEIVLYPGGYFPSPLTDWYRERSFKVALAGSLLVHAMLLALVPGFRAVSIDVPAVLDVEILIEEQPRVVPLPVKRQAESKPETKSEIVPPQPVIEQPVPRPEPRVRSSEPVIRQPEPIMQQPVPDAPPVPRTDVIQATPRLVPKPEFAMPKPDPRPAPDIDPRPAPSPEIRPESPVPRAESPQTAPPVQPDRARAAPVLSPAIPQTAEPQAPTSSPVAAPPAPNAPVVTKTEPAAERALTTGYEKSLSDLIRRHERYPDRARRQHWEGTVVISLSLSADGKVTNISVVESSGREILDEAALEMVRRASPLPRAPEGLRGKERSVRVPIAFKLAAS